MHLLAAGEDHGAVSNDQRGREPRLKPASGEALPDGNRIGLPSVCTGGTFEGDDGVTVVGRATATARTRATTQGSQTRKPDRAGVSPAAGGIGWDMLRFPVRA